MRRPREPNQCPAFLADVSAGEMTAGLGLGMKFVEQFLAMAQSPIMLSSLAREGCCRFHMRCRDATRGSEVLVAGITMPGDEQAAQWGC